MESKKIFQDFEKKEKIYAILNHTMFSSKISYFYSIF